MHGRFSPQSLWNRLTSTYWFVPAVMMLGAIALGVTLTVVDRRYPEAISWLGWAYGGGADGARALLSAIAGSTVTVVGVTFSVLIVALTVSSQHFGPRLLNSFTKDRVAQLVLGTFTGTFVYCLVVLRTVQGEGGDRYSVFVPHLAVTGAVVVTLLSVGMLIYYVHHVARSMQFSEIASRIVIDFERSIDRLYPEPIGETVPSADPAPPPVPATALTIESAESGYVQEIDAELVMKVACEHDTMVWLITRPGDFIVPGMPLAAAFPTPENPERVVRRIRQALLLGNDRTSVQDAAFAIQQLVEVALRALSPGVNEPFTAITSIDRLGQGLVRLAERRLPSALRTDEEGNPRVVAQPKSFAELLSGAFEPIALAADGNAAVIERLLVTLQLLATRVRRPEDRAALAALADLVNASAARIPHERVRAESGRLHQQLRRMLEER